MSWDLLVLAMPAEFATMDDIPPDYPGAPLGPAAVVLQQLRDHFGDRIGLADPAWGHLAGAGWAIELNIGRKDPIDSIMLHVRGGGEDLIAAIVSIADAVGGRALDFSEGVFLTGAPGEANSWQAFQDYRAQVLAGSATAGGGRREHGEDTDRPQ